MAQSRYYSATAQPTVLTASITPTTTVIQLQQVTGLPPNTPYILALDYNTPSEEIVLVTAAAGTNLTVTRGYDGTSATSHNAGAAVRHTWTAMDGNDSRAHEGSTSGVHGVAGNVVGTTDTQTLTNKTINSATINSPTVNSPTFTGTVNLASPNITGTVTGGASYTAPTVTNPTVTGTVAGGASYTAPTITNPTVTGTVAGGAVYQSPIAEGVNDATPSIIARRRSATQTGALINFRDETNAQLPFVSFDGVARWRQGMSGGSADQMHVTSSGSIDTTSTVTATGGLLAGSSNQFTVSSTGAPRTTATNFASSNVQSAGSVTFTNTTYGDTGTLIQTTCVVPPSGKVQIMGRTGGFSGTGGTSIWSTINVVGSSSGTLRSSIDGNAIEVRLNTNMASALLPGFEGFIQTATPGETLTIKWQHRVSANAGSIDYRSLSAIPLMN